ncbi:hypothetical protein [Chryseobacterium sp. HSC-36S06]|uniref:hypothetical protein n=1 Tax=Chryseobacterium sp. HSC-36S06 TaxID=2910970 RepID=UPI00209C7CAA|nr:hypothetical protein [Chryseobacterium sp. HSC-36S06]MCP2038166.1 hypothetical protein [Chryseobacterium sp. HSC-36S06]
MENPLLRISFGETNYYAKVLQHNKDGFKIEILFPVEGILYSEWSHGDYQNVSYFEERILKAFKEKLIFSIEIIYNKENLRQKLQELEFSLMLFIDEEQSPEKQNKIKQIFGEQFLKNNFPYAEFTNDMVNYLLNYLDFSAEYKSKAKRVIKGSLKHFLDGFEQKAIHSIINNKA